jgi:hypothetical protein
MEVKLGALTCEAPDLVAPEGGLLELALDFGGLTLQVLRSVAPVQRSGPEGTATPRSTRDLNVATTTMTSPPSALL